MTINELYSELQIQSPMKILSAYSGRVLCYQFDPKKEEHQKLGERKILDIWAEMRVGKRSGYGNYADVILCAYADGRPEYEKDWKEATP